MTEEAAPLPAMVAGRRLVQHDNGGFQHPDDPGEPSLSSHGKPRISISDKEAAILSALAIDQDVVELGTGLGVSTRALLKWAWAVRTVDIDAWVQETIWPELQTEYGARLGCIPDREKLVKSYKPDVVFIDADHSPEAVARDVEFAKRIVHRPGLIIMHDTNFENVHEGLAILGISQDDWAHVPTEHGLGLLVVTD